MSGRARIALNAQLLRLDADYRSAGIARYIWHSMCALPAAAPDLELHAFTGEARAKDAIAGADVHRTRWPTRSPLGRILWEQLVLPAHLDRGAYSLLHSFAFVSPLFMHLPSVVTVYDMSFALYPELFRPLNRLYLQRMTRASVARAARVIAISNSTRRDLVRLFRLDPHRVDVLQPGVDSTFFQPRSRAELDRLIRDRRLPERFVLFLGTLEPRKNIPTLIRAFMRARRERSFPQSLVIAGGRGWMDEGIARAIQDTGAGSRVMLAGFVPQEELATWYQAADAFVYPSQYEGFGMPPLEALASGTPTVTSNLSALPEAVGDAALLVDPHDEAALAEAIGRILTEEPLRAELKERGREHARGFTWERTASGTAEVYRQALGLGSPSRTTGS